IAVLASDPRSDRPAWRACWFNQGVRLRPSRTSVHSAHASPAAHRRAPGGRPPGVIPMVVRMHAPWFRSPSQRPRSPVSLAGLRLGTVTDGGYPDAWQRRSAASAPYTQRERNGVLLRVSVMLLSCGDPV